MTPVRPNARASAPSSPGRDFHSALLARRENRVSILAALARTADWANAHRDEVAAALSEITGVPIAPQTVAVGRVVYAIFPLTDAVIPGQQATADRFQKLGLIPKPIAVRDIVWQAPKADRTLPPVRSSPSCRPPSHSMYFWFIPIHGDGSYLGSETQGGAVPAAETARRVARSAGRVQAAA